MSLFCFLFCLFILYNPFSYPCSIISYHQGPGQVWVHYCHCVVQVYYFGALFFTWEMRMLNQNEVNWDCFFLGESHTFKRISKGFVNPKLALKLKCLLFNFKINQNPTSFFPTAIGSWYSNDFWIIKISSVFIYLMLSFKLFLKCQVENFNRCHH